MMNQKFILAACLGLSPMVWAEEAQNAVCEKYSSQLEDLAADVQSAADADEANEYRADFINNYPDAQVCVGADQVAAVGGIEPAAGGDEGGDAGDTGGEGENPGQLNEEPEAGPQEELPPEEEPCEFEKNYEEEPCYECET